MVMTQDQGNRYVRAQVPETAPLTTDSLKMLMNDAGRILGAVVCLGELTKGDSDDEGGTKRVTDDEAAQYQVTIASLQQQLSESKSAQHELQRRLDTSSAADPEAAGGAECRPLAPRGSVSFSPLPEKHGV